MLTCETFFAGQGIRNYVKYDPISDIHTDPKKFVSSLMRQHFLQDVHMIGNKMYYFV